MEKNNELNLVRDVKTDIATIISQAKEMTYRGGIYGVGTPFAYSVGTPQSYIDKIGGQISSARGGYNELKNMKDSHFWTIGRNKAKAEKTQEVLEHVIDAVDNNANATKALFNNQIKLANAANHLYRLGVMGIAANRIVMREIKLRLQNASQEELGELARRELESVLDELEKQSALETKIEELSKTIGQRAVTSSLSTGLHKEIKKLDEELIGVDHKINNINNSISSINIHANKSDDAINKIRSNIGDISNRTNKVDNAINELTNTHSSFSKKVAKDFTRIDGVIRQVKDNINIRVDKANDAISEINSDIVNINKRANKADDLIKDIEDNIITINDHANETDDAINEIRGNIGEINNRTNKVDDAINELTNTHSSFSKKVVEDFTRIDGVIQQLNDNINIRVDKANDAISEINSDLVNINIRANKADDLIHDIKDNIININDRANKTDDAINEIRGNIGDINNRADKTDGAISEIRDNIGSIIIRANKTNDSISQIRGNIGEIKECVNKTDNAINEIANTHSTFSNEVAEKFASVDDIIQKVDDNINDNVNKIGDAISEIKGTYSVFSNEVAAYFTKLDDVIKMVDHNIHNLEAGSTNHQERLEHLEKKSFFDSAFYKVLVGLSALGALALSILNYLS